MSVVVLGLVAFAVDVGYMLSSKQELQRTADAAALAACWEFANELANGVRRRRDERRPRRGGGVCRQTTASAASIPPINQNLANTDSGDLVFGEISDLFAYGSPMSTCDADKTSTPCA